MANSKKKPAPDDVIPMRDPSRGRDGRGRPMLTIPRRRLVNEAPRRSSQPATPEDPPAGA